MKSFLKNVLANIVAILILGMVLFGFLMLAVLASAVGNNKKAHVKSNSVLILGQNLSVVESDNEIEDGPFNFNKKDKFVKLYDVLKAIENAKTDDKIKGISIEADNFKAGITQTDAIRRAIEDFKKSGKFVYAYGNVVSQSSYYLGSVADQYFLNPSGGIELKGMASELAFFKEFADKYGIGVDVIRHGKFKAAVEPFLRNDMSPENREQLTTLLNDIWGNTSSKISSSRKIDPTQFKTIVDSLYGIIPDLSLKYKLADKLIQKTEYDNMLKAKLNVSKDDDLNKISVYKYASTFDKDVNQKDSQVAVLYASGEIFNGNENKNIYSEKFVKHIKELADDDHVKAVVFRINSPGGSANASDEILFELQQLKAKKPLVVSFGDYAASGGYYIAMAANKIFAEPNTITGSIGVFGIIMNAKDLAQRNGIRADVVQTNENSDMYSLLNGVSPGTLNIMTRSVEQTYKRFVHFVTVNRKKSFEEIDTIGGGRVWSGQRGKEIGLVDEMGSLQDAINYAAKQAKLSTYNVGSYPEKVSPFEELFKDMDEDKIAAKIIQNKMGKENYQIFEKLTNAGNQGQVLMEMPYQISIK